MPERFFTVDELADLLQLNPQTVRNWIDAGTLGAVRVGSRRVRVRESELERFLAAGETRTPGEGVQAQENAVGSSPLDGEGETGIPAQLMAVLSETLPHVGIGDSGELASALRKIAAAAESLASALDATKS